MVSGFLDNESIYHNIVMKDLYSHRHGKLKHFHEKHHVFPVREVGKPIVLSTLIAKCLYKKKDSGITQ